MSGASILEQVVRYGYSDGLADRERGVAITGVARLVTGVADGRKISAAVRKLEKAELVEVNRDLSVTFVRPTERGIQVDKILEKITAARGGTFVPWTQTDLTTTERLALH